jgi:hypothetical protein
MSNIIEALSYKFSKLDSDSIEKEWKSIEKEGSEVDPLRVEALLKSTPGFSMVDMINFGEYCRNGFTQYEWEDKSIEDHFVDWLNKIQ